MNKLRHNRFLIPVLVVTVLAVAFTNTLLQKANHANLSFLSISVIFVISLLSGIGVISIIWNLASRWPKAGGVVFLVLSEIGIFGAIPAYCNGGPGFNSHNPALLGLLIVSSVLFAVAGVLLLFSKKVMKNEASS